MRRLLRRFFQPWVLWSVHDSQVEGDVAVVWRNRLPLLVLLILVGLQLTAPARVWKMLLLAFSLITVIGGLWTWEMARQVRVWRELPVSWVQTGDLLRERFSVVNGSLMPALCVEIRDYSDIPGYSVSTVRTVGSGASLEWVTRGEVHLRGEYQMGPWEVTVCDPFGIFAMVQRNVPPQSVLVYPPIAQQLVYPLPRGAASGRSRTSRSSWSPTVTVGTVREYTAGDPQRHIHWPTTARRMRLYTKEFDQESGGDIWLVLDLDRDVQVGSGEHSTQEFSVILAGSITAHLLDAGRAVGLILYGRLRHIVPPARGRGQLWEVLRALARARADESLSLSRVLDQVARTVPPGTSVLVITPSADSAWVSALVRLQGGGVGVAALLVDGTPFEHAESEVNAAPSSQETEDSRLVGSVGAVYALRGMLADAQIESEVISGDLPLFLRPPTGTVRRWEFRIGGTGRATAVSRPWGVA